MHFLRKPSPALNPKRVAPPTRRLGRPLAGGVLVAASIAVTACGSSGSPATINANTIERAIADSSLAQRGIHAQVSCPSGVPDKQGLVFYCTAVVNRGSTTFVVTELNGSGAVHYEAR
jgi:hypothetical protein